MSWLFNYLTMWAEKRHIFKTCLIDIYRAILDVPLQMWIFINKCFHNKLGSLDDFTC